MSEENFDVQNYDLDDEVDNSKKLKIVIVILAIIALVLGGYLVYKSKVSNDLISQLDAEKQELLADMVSLQEEYAMLSSDYDALNLQLDSSRAEVSLLIEKMNKTEATNRSLIRRYQKELGTLRSIMKNYIVQIDSLNASNKKYKADAAAARKEAAESRKQLEEQSKTVEGLESMVAAGAVIKARGLKLETFAGNDKLTDRSSRAKKMTASLALVENDLAEKGEVRVYVRVKGPDGVLLTNKDSRQFSVAGGEPMLCSASRKVDYQGKEVELVIYINDIAEFTKGIYTVEAYTEQTKLGETELMLR